MASVQWLENEFEKHRNLDNASHMAKYMRNQFDFYGIKTPERRSIYKELLNECWNNDYREFQYFVCDYLKALQKFLVFDDIDKIRPFIKTKQWWDTIDSLDTVIGNINDLRVDDLMLEWSVSDDIWFRRIAINHQRGRKDKTDTVLLEKILINNLNNNEFFINKAIGWVLRDYSKTNTDWVKNFIAKYKPGLSTLSIREASKYLE
ncbi:DNA alkylation repair protein [Ligilactobacillus salivarius]|uniref:DNA alkylation repair protein n=1 Tax=Ligilactobacillus salivarius TaxID=1624 RepID=UPI000A2DADDC|nr:DNA alkylation repair protein [Ligilactobacillus salivarius]OTF88859.1 DNA alkylation repair protein [Ligilactobacillus salivarius]PAY40655.1 DNA alkylation repair protein [Ligilactobacillus salivarius]PAY48699.1 DNA alkylation repair protein [Ligilactobacillus salivarius]PAY60886.1 DNA alkylation repair protein [Ligilactobacillus salivarius]